MLETFIGYVVLATLLGNWRPMAFAWLLIAASVTHHYVAG
jgi:hypothetical protein